MDKKSKHPKLIKALNFLEEEYEDFYNCNKCQGGGDLEKAIDYHIKHCKRK